MEFFITDWRDFSWFMFSWSEHSHPAIAIRLRLFSYVLALTYFRWRPQKYLDSYPVDVSKDKHLVFDWPSVYRDKWLRSGYQLGYDEGIILGRTFGYNTRKMEEQNGKS